MLKRSQVFKETFMLQHMEKSEGNTLDDDMTLELPNPCDNYLHRMDDNLEVHCKALLDLQKDCTTKPELGMTVTDGLDTDIICGEKNRKVLESPRFAVEQQSRKTSDFVAMNIQVPSIPNQKTSSNAIPEQLLGIQRDEIKGDLELQLPWDPLADSPCLASMRNKLSKVEFFSHKKRTKNNSTKTLVETFEKVSLEAAKVRPSMATSSAENTANQLQNKCTDSNNDDQMSKQSPDKVEVVKVSKTIVSIEVSPEFQEVIEFLSVSIHPFLARLKEKGIINQERDIVDLTPDYTRFTVKQAEISLAQDKHSGDGGQELTYKLAVCLHILVGALELLVHCGIGVALVKTRTNNSTNVGVAQPLPRTENYSIRKDGRATSEDPFAKYSRDQTIFDASYDKATSKRIPKHRRFEILFCVQDESDTAVPVVRQLMQSYPLVNARLFTVHPKTLLEMVSHMGPKVDIGLPVVLTDYVASCGADDYGLPVVLT
ncbi:hypothetical protein QZH41_007856 [Actinostola sp. cb2023]|nr:hypothetical protein QZH41_007856 [Actinostola sp. cb2023]